MDAVELVHGNAANAEFMNRREFIVQSHVVNLVGQLHVVNLVGQLHVDLFLQNKFLINNVDVKIVLVRSKDAFVLKCPMRFVDCNVYAIPTGARSHTHENLFPDTLLKRLVLCYINNDEYNGSYARNPFHAKNNINFLFVYVDGRQVPAKPLQPDFDNKLYIRSYNTLFSSTSKAWQDEGNGLSLSDFRHGYTFIGFDLTPDVCDGSWFRLVQKGNLRIEMHFCDTLPNIIYIDVV